jgi:hypothetical protein
LNLQPTRPHLKIAGRASDFLTAFLLVHQLPKITRVDKTHFKFYEPAETARETTETRSREKIDKSHLIPMASLLTFLNLPKAFALLPWSN